MSPAIKTKRMEVTITNKYGIVINRVAHARKQASVELYWSLCHRYRNDQAYNVNLVRI